MPRLPVTKALQPSWASLLTEWKQILEYRSINPLPAGLDPQSDFGGKLASLRAHQREEAPYLDDPDDQGNTSKDDLNFNHITISRDATQRTGHLQEQLSALGKGKLITAKEFATGVAFLDSQYHPGLASLTSGVQAIDETRPHQNSPPFTIDMEEPEYMSTERSSSEYAESRSDSEVRSNYSPSRRAVISYGNAHNEAPREPLSNDDLHHRIRQLETELLFLKSTGGPDNSALGTERTSANLAQEKWCSIHRVHDIYYLDRPKPKLTRRGMKIRGSIPLKDVHDYLQRHPTLDFVVIQDYSTESSSIHDQSKDKDYHPEPERQSIWLNSDPMIRAIVRLSGLFPDFRIAFPTFTRDNVIHDPSIFMYFLYPNLHDRLSQLGDLEQETVKTLFDYLEQSVGAQCREAISHINSAAVFSRHVKYLVRPGEVVATLSPTVEAFMVLSWPSFLGCYESNPDESTYTTKGEPSEEAQGEDDTTLPPDEMRKHDLWNFTAWRLGYNGRFYREHETLEMQVDTRDAIQVSKLEFFPLSYATSEAKDFLRKRGETYWRSREKSFVGYCDEKGEFETVSASPNKISSPSFHSIDKGNERFMVDFATYNKLHPSWNDDSHDFITWDAINQKEPPQDDFIYLFPLTVIGYNLQLKKWEDIEVDRIREVQWDKKAFENLVIDNETKHLIQSLISSRIAADKSTDLIRGKGNGLIMLLHGGPGTGKTFTAESVAELAEKPLYRVTCGDIGTTPVDVEKYLESVLHLGKIWDCVVLLDEADVFLEERSLSDLQRNALVSVFLRVLEYYDGILILTSNRVGTFDQAFKSRIQLALHYEDLTKPQRRKIWRNFFNRLKEVDKTNIDFDDLFDHIDDLANEEMNGRQIRNSITIARQLAQYDGKEFSYEQLKLVIRVSAKFDGYLKGVYHGLTQEDIARDTSLR